MRHYCTLFDSKFLPQGLALYESLKRHSSEPFTLSVLAMDEKCSELLWSMGLPLSVTPLDAFLYKTQLNQGDHTWAEFCWLCASNFALYLARESGRPITYLDADLLFFSDPKQVFAELGNRSLAIIPHRFPWNTRRELLNNGRFNVSWVSFQNEIGFSCLEHWAHQCREWCYYKNEDGKFGDQKYLDAWPEMYGSECVEVANIGAGAAPWNVSEYKVSSDQKGGVRLDGQPLVFYHFHEYVHNRRLTNYPLSESVVKLIYGPYIQAVNSAKDCNRNVRETVCVIIPTFGDKVVWDKFAARALASVAAQTRPPDEIIRSHEATLQLARNRAMASSCKWLVFLDADDELSPNYLHAMLAGIGDIRVPFIQRVRQGVAGSVGVLKQPGASLYERNHIPIGAMIRRDMFVEVGGFDDWPVYEDWILWMKLEKAGAVWVCCGGAVYRIHWRAGSRNSQEHLRAPTLARGRAFIDSWKVPPKPS